MIFATFLLIKIFISPMIAVRNFSFYLILYYSASWPSIIESGISTQFEQERQIKTKIDGHNNDSGLNLLVVEGKAEKFEVTEKKKNFYHFNVVT